MDNKKKLTIVLAVLAVVCVFAVLVFSGIIDFSNVGGEELTTDADISNYYENISSKATGTSTSPYLSTPIDDIFYTMSMDGEVLFYRFENNSFTQIDASGTYTATVTLSEENISADITYLNEDGKICGYGLYTSTDGAYTLNPYVFFYLRNYGEDYTSAYSTSCLLLVDTTEDDFYSDDKVYEESFIFKYADSSASRSLAEASRTIGMNGAKRNDYFVISDKVVDGSVDHQLFLSGRFYSEADTTVDLFRSGGSGNNTDNIRLATDILGNWAEYTDDGIMYITVDDNENVVIEILNESSGDTTVVKTFDNVKRNDILVCDDYIYVISQNVLYSIDDDKEISITTGYDNFKADMFEIDEDTLMLRGYSDNAYAVMLVASAETGAVSASYKNEICRYFVNPVIVNGQVIVTSAMFGSTSTTNNIYTYYVF